MGEKKVSPVAIRVCFVESKWVLAKFFGLLNQRESSRRTRAPFSSFESEREGKIGLPNKRNSLQVKEST